MEETGAIKERFIRYNQFDPNLKPSFPTNMSVELTNACNYKCIFCANRKMKRKIGHIDMNLLARLLNEAYSLGTTDIGLYTTGEPFVSKELEKSIAIAKKIGFNYVYITTNGALATPERLKKVVDAGLDSIKFSINAGIPQTYKYIHGRDEFYKVLSNLQFAHKYREENNKDYSIYVSYVIMRDNHEECDTLKTLIEPFVDDLIFDHARNQGGMMPELNDDNNAAVIPPLDEKKICSLPFNKIHITCEGFLTICCADFENNLVVADLNKESLKDAWNNDLFVEIRRRSLEHKLEGTLCYNCLYNKNMNIEPLINLLSRIN